MMEIKRSLFFSVVLILYWVLLALFLNTGYSLNTTNQGSNQTGWYELGDYQYAYVSLDIIIAEVWAGDNAGWDWFIYLKTDTDERDYSGTECCLEDAIEAVNFIMFGAYWM